ncbi:membrane protein insertase YidC [Candidatus Saccharibacteria bacterium]|nr:membrane protein insertase YidC [Candidatus Saccharibacteria bacterium]
MREFLRAILTQPLFNLLIVLYALIPGNDFGVAIIIFTVIIRLMLWPLLKKQLHQQKAMKELQPEISKIKQRSKGDKQKEAQAMMELYKEREINPLGSLGVVLLQFPILIALFLMLRGVVADHTTVAKLSYDFVKQLGAVADIIAKPAEFKPYLLGVVDLSRAAYTKTTGIYWPAVPLAFGAGIGQFLQSRQLMAKSKDSKSLKSLLNDAKEGREVSKSEQNEAMTSSMTSFLPVITLIFAFGFPAALSLYWTASSFIAVLQQRSILGRDVEEMSKVKIIEEPAVKPKKAKTLKSKKKKGRR